MAIIFCPHCGSKSTYQFAMPNFCSKCGQAYLSKSSANLKIKKTAPDDEEDEENFEEDGDFDRSESFSNSSIVPNISRIQVELDFSTSEVKSFKFGEIFGENNSEQKFPIRRARNINDLL